MTYSADRIPEETLEWLLAPEDPGARYLTQLHLIPTSQADLAETRDRAYREGPIGQILDQMQSAGFWEKEGPGYLPKYRSTVWSLILLAQLGAAIDHDQRIAGACGYFLDQAMTEIGQLTINGAPSTNIDCLQGNLLAALVDLGYQDSRIKLGYEWLARSVTGDGVAPFSEKKAPVRYYSGNIGPLFRCGANLKDPCAWGGAKAMIALGKLDPAQRTPLLQKAIDQGVDFFFSMDPSTGEYPHGENPKPSGNWWKFGFPVFYVTDLLQVFEALARLGFGSDPRLENTRKLILDKMTPDGKWMLEYGYKGKTWVDFGEMKKPSKWVTIRAYHTLSLI